MKCMFCPNDVAMSCDENQHEYCTNRQNLLKGTPHPVETKFNTPRSRLLDEAMKITHHDRNANYGSPEDNFKQIANLWNAYLGKSASDFEDFLTPADVAIMNMLIKVARLANNPQHHDSAVDIAGYAACLADIQESMRGSTPKQDGTASA